VRHQCSLSATAVVGWQGLKTPVLRFTIGEWPVPITCNCSLRLADNHILLTWPAGYGYDEIPYSVTPGEQAHLLLSTHGRLCTVVRKVRGNQ
jgi:hypothetical protein